MVSAAEVSKFAEEEKASWIACLRSFANPMVLPYFALTCLLFGVTLASVVLVIEDCKVFFWGHPVVNEDMQALVVFLCIFVYSIYQFVRTYQSEA